MERPSDVSSVYEIPDTLLSRPTLLRPGHRFVTTFHGGPASTVPGLQYGPVRPSSKLDRADRGMLDKIYSLRMRAPACKIALVTVLRHPAAQLLSSWAYVADPTRTTLAKFAAAFPADQLMGVRANVAGASVVADDSAARRARIVIADRELWGRFDVVGHTERFAATLLLISDATGLKHLLVQPTPDNAGPCELDLDPAQRAGAAYAAANSSEFSASAWAQAVALRPELSEWYEERLQAFDERLKATAGFDDRLDSLVLARERAQALTNAGNTVSETPGQKRTREAAAQDICPPQSQLRWPAE